MQKVYLYSLLLTAGLVISQFLGGRARTGIELLTLISLAFLVIHIGYGFEITRTQPQEYLWDGVVGSTTAVFPWLLCTVYFVVAMAPAELWWSRSLWWKAVVLGRFAGPTSVGLLFSMLAAAGLSGSWIYNKARVLAIFDDLQVILLFVPVKVLLVTLNAQLIIATVVIFGLLWAAWKYLRVVNLPVNWPWVLLYSAIIVTASEGLNFGIKVLDDAAPVEVEVLLLAFVLGGILARSPQVDASCLNPMETGSEQSVTTIVAACFMALAGLSMPPLSFSTNAMQMHEAVNMARQYQSISPEVVARILQFPGWGLMTIHVLALTVLSNLGKMLPALCYRKEARPRERLALAVGMFPRGEVGAGMLLVALSHGVAGAPLIAAVLSLALNLLCSGLFVFVIKKLVTPNV